MKDQIRRYALEGLLACILLFIPLFAFSQSPSPGSAETASAPPASPSPTPVPVLDKLVVTRIDVAGKEQDSALDDKIRAQVERVFLKYAARVSPEVEGGKREAGMTYAVASLKYEYEYESVRDGKNVNYYANALLTFRLVEEGSGRVLASINVNSPKVFATSRMGVIVNATLASAYMGVERAIRDYWKSLENGKEGTGE